MQKFIKIDGTGSQQCKNQNARQRTGSKRAKKGTNLNEIKYAEHCKN